MIRSARHGIAARSLTTLAFTTLFFAVVAQTLQAVEPLHQQIDGLLDASRVEAVAPVAGDADFMRRVYLDLTGSIPSSVDAKAFLADKAPNKRTVLVDRLLASEAYVRHMANVFDVMLMERLGDKHVKANEWTQYLRTSIQQNKPYNQLVSEILTADGSDPKTRAAAKFILDRDVDANRLTKDVGRVFFGVDLECAQCHDHPNVEDYFQADYYGVFSFLSRTYLFQPDKKKPAVLAEKPDGAVNFKSVFTEVEQQTRPRLLGEIPVTEPTFAAGSEYKVKPDKKNKNLRPIPTYSRRAKFAALVASGTNQAFRRNIVNRLWAHMMGRGLVHPVDLHHVDNPPSHPELLQLLADDFAAGQFNIKSLLRELALTRAYQRALHVAPSVEPPAAPEKQKLVALAAALDARELELADAEGALELLDATVETSRETLIAAHPALDKAKAAAAAGRKAAAATAKPLAEAQKQHAAMLAKAQSVSAALAAADKAAKQAASDKELLQAVAAIRTRATHWNNEAAILQKNVAAKQAAVTQAAASVAAADKQVAAAQAEQQSASTKYEQDRKKLYAARETWKAARRASGHITAQIEGVRTLQEAIAKRAAVRAAEAALAKASTGLPAVRKAVETGTQQAKAAQAALAVGTKAMSDAEAALASGKQKLTTAQQTAALLSESLAKAQVAAKALPADKALAQAVVAVKQQSDAQTAAVAAQQQAMAEMEKARAQAAAQMPGLNQRAEQTKAALAAAQKGLSTTTAQVNAATTKLDADRAAFEERNTKLTKHRGSRFDVATLESLAPEQLAHSTLRATGQYDATRRGVEAELNKKSPLKPEEQKDAAKVAERQRQIDAQTADKLKGPVGTFVKLFGAGAGQPQGPFFATVDQALYYSNGGEIRSWLTPRSGNLTDRLVKLGKPEEMAEELYLSVLTRRPSAEETTDVAEYLKSRGEKKNEAVQEMAWALLTSVEFRFHH
ncbi:MAG: hypothetical protein CMJ48_13960 [Planctomycetaceae bacterium]|nr:hypothetical protein [Planctomycetaceae bacterium]